MNTKALICGLEGHSINDAEREFFKVHQPWGFILFARNVDDPEQLSALTTDLKSCVDHEQVPILIDQEGGRVQRLRPPHWTQYPPAARMGQIYEQNAEAGKRATWLLSRLHAFDLSKVGVNVNCLPVVDVPSEDGHEVIGDRAYGDEPKQVTNLGRSACEGLMAGGVMPVIKHIPGHGRAAADSHHKLPRVDATIEALEKTDFEPFKALNDIEMAMTAHVIYSSIDPKAPATTSKLIMDEVVRGHMQYDGLVMSDDITMNALSGDLTERTEAIFEAGCDIVLHCTGKMDEMVEVANATPLLADKALKRAERAMVKAGKTDNAVEADCRAEFNELLNQNAVLAQAADVADPTDYGKT